MHKNIEVLIGRLATDPGLQRRFAEQPVQVLRAEGLELTEIELAALAATDAEALCAFTDALDTRLRRASSGRPERGTTPTESDSDSGKEIQR